MSSNGENNYIETTPNDDRLDGSKPVILDTGNGQSRIDAILHEIRLHCEEWNVGQIVGTFSEVGMLLIDDPPTESLNERIAPRALLIGLNAAVYLIRGVLFQPDVPSPQELMSVQRQFVYIIVLAGYAKQGDLLLSAATALHKHVLEPHADRFGYGDAESIFRFGYAVAVNFLTRFCLEIGIQELPEGKDNPPTNDEVERIVDIASNVFVSSPSGTGTRWLRDYMRRHRGASWLTDEELTIDQEE